MSIEPCRFLHTGDLHRDSPVKGLSSEAPPDILAVLRGATTEAWAAAIRELAERDQVVYFTCHPWIADLLDADGTRTIRLG